MQRTAKDLQMWETSGVIDSVYSVCCFHPWISIVLSSNNPPFNKARLSSNHQAFPSPCLRWLAPRRFPASAYLQQYNSRLRDVTNYQALKLRPIGLVFDATCRSACNHPLQQLYIQAQPSSLPCQSSINENLLSLQCHPLS